MHVHAGWVTDTDQYNEWLDEEDYCIPHIKSADGTTKNPCRKFLLKDVSLPDTTPATPIPAAVIDDVGFKLHCCEILVE